MCCGCELSLYLCFSYSETGLGHSASTPVFGNDSSTVMSDLHSPGSKAPGVGKLQSISTSSANLCASVMHKLQSLDSSSISQYTPTMDIPGGGSPAHRGNSRTFTFEPSQTQKHIRFLDTTTSGNSSVSPNVTFSHSTFHHNSALSNSTSSNSNTVRNAELNRAIEEKLRGAQTYRAKHGQDHLNNIIDRSFASKDEEKVENGDEDTVASSAKPDHVDKYSKDLDKRVKSYGETICDLHSDFENVNVKITKKYVDGGFRGARGTEATGGRALAIDGNTAGGVLKMAQKLDSLRDEDNLVQQALSHRERVNQYKHISEIFDEFIAPGSRTATSVNVDSESDDDI